MNRNKSIKIKAAILLIVFSVNTVVAFACSLGLKMGYNNHHHQEEKTLHNSQPRHHGAHHHGASGSHYHPNLLHADCHKKTSGSVQHPGKNAGKDDCCADSAKKFQQEDKKLQETQNASLKAPALIASLSTFLTLEPAPARVTAVTKYLIPHYYPPPPDIRIAIQSFQI